MPTDNKKISAYVPDVVYDRFKQFQEEHKLSMSQAAIEIFAAYFGINLNPTIPSNSTSELQSRLETLEKALADLQETHFALSKKVDLLQSASEPPVSESVEVFVHKDIDRELDSSLYNEPLQENIAVQPIDIPGISELQSIPESEPPKQLRLINSDSILSKLKSNPLQAKVLANRLGVKPPDISIKKSKARLEEFYDWLQSKDIDSIRWLLIGEGKKARYIPAGDTSSEQLQALGNWLESNT
jgi:hypothetical protein